MDGPIGSHQKNKKSRMLVKNKEYKLSSLHLKAHRTLLQEYFQWSTRFRLETVHLLQENKKKLCMYVQFQCSFEFEPAFKISRCHAINEEFNQSIKLIRDCFKNIFNNQLRLGLKQYLYYMKIKKKQLQVQCSFEFEPKSIISATMP